MIAELLLSVFFIGIVVSTCAFGVSVLLDRDSLVVFFGLSIIIFTLLALFASANVETQFQKAISMCINDGYTTAYEQSDNYYCLRFGSEPEIVFLEGSEDE